MAGHVKRSVVGALIAVSGAFVWAMFELVWRGDGPQGWGVPLMAACAVLMTSWFVVPMGCLLGWILPAVIRHRSLGQAFIRGALLGVVAGVVAVGLTILFLEWPLLSGQGIISDREAWLQGVRRDFLHFAATMIPICVLWVGVWACRWRTIAEPCASANGAPRRR